MVWKNIIALFVFSASLGGCIELREQISLQRGGLFSPAKFALRREMLIEHQLYDRLPPGDRNAICNEGRQQHPNAVTSTVISEMREGYFVCRLTIEGPALITSDGVGVYSAKADDLVRIRVDARTIAKMAPPPPPDQKDIIREMFIGRSYRVTLSAPKIYSTNGRLNEDKTEAVWELPMVDLIDGRSDDHMVFTADVQNPF